MNNKEKKMLLERMKYSILTFSPAIFAMVFISIQSGLLSNWVWSLFFFLVGCSGLIIVIRQEIPMSLRSIKGKSAITQGAILLIFCWGLAIFSAIWG